jgi:hypothetical protein
MKPEGPKHAVKFMAKVREEDLDEAMDVLRGSVVPSLREMGLGELLVLTRRRKLEKLDPLGSGVTPSPVLERLLKNAPPDDPGYARDLRRMHLVLGQGGPENLDSAYAYHRLKGKYPAEYAMLREERFDDANLLKVAGCQIDCYGLWNTETHREADTSDMNGRSQDGWFTEFTHVFDTKDAKANRPRSAEIVAEELDHLLFPDLSGIYYTVVSRAPWPKDGKIGTHALRTRIPILLRGLEDAGDDIRSALVPVLAGQEGFEGALVLRSRGKGFIGELGWSPSGSSEHSGELSSAPKSNTTEGLSEFSRKATVEHECVSLWETEAAMKAGGEQLAGYVLRTLGDVVPEDWNAATANIRYDEAVAPAPN